MKKQICATCLMFSMLFAGLALAAEKPAKAPKDKAASTDTKKAAKKPDKPVDINNASETELTTLPGVGAKMAKEIVAARPFQSVDDLKKVKGIGDKNFSMMQPHVVCNPVKK